MTRHEMLEERLRGGARILIDGATGTEVERRGVPQLDGAWNGGAALSHPEILRAIHEDYIRAGAEIIISNTFATGRHTLADAGEAANFAAYNRRGVEIAIEARAALERPDVLVAGGISYWSFTDRHPPLSVLADGVAAQAKIMAEAGADLLMLEMMVEIDRMLTTLEAAQTCGLPVWVGLSAKPNDAGLMCLYRGEPLADAVAALAERAPAGITIMHTEVAYVDACLDILDGAWDGLVGVYAHTGGMVDGKWTFEDMITPAAYALAARRWLARGVGAVGGCCGIRPAHIERLRAEI
ncbi:MAG: homocysteine S-methyltransferase family protein [Pikeienuella sp.]